MQMRTTHALNNTYYQLQLSDWLFTYVHLFINIFSYRSTPLHWWLSRSFPLIARSLNVQRDITQIANQMDNLAVSSAVTAFIRHMHHKQKNACDVRIAETTNSKCNLVRRLPMWFVKSAENVTLPFHSCWGLAPEHPTQLAGIAAQP